MVGHLDPLTRLNVDRKIAVRVEQRSKQLFILLLFPLFLLTREKTQITALGTIPRAVFVMVSLTCHRSICYILG